MSSRQRRYSRGRVCAGYIFPALMEADPVACLATRRRYASNPLRKGGRHARCSIGLTSESRFKSFSLAEFSRDYGRDLRKDGIFIRSKAPLPWAAPLARFPSRGRQVAPQGPGEVRRVVIGSSEEEPSAWRSSSTSSPRKTRAGFGGSRSSPTLEIRSRSSRRPPWSQRYPPGDPRRLRRRSRAGDFRQTRRARRASRRDRGKTDTRPHEEASSSRRARQRRAVPQGRGDLGERDVEGDSRAAPPHLVSSDRRGLLAARRPRWVGCREGLWRGAFPLFVRCSREENGRGRGDLHAERLHRQLGPSSWMPPLSTAPSKSKEASRGENPKPLKPPPGLLRARRVARRAAPTTRRPPRHRPRRDRLEHKRPRPWPPRP